MIQTAQKVCVNESKRIQFSCTRLCTYVAGEMCSGTRPPLDHVTHHIPLSFLGALASAKGVQLPTAWFTVSLSSLDWALGRLAAIGGDLSGGT